MTTQPLLVITANRCENLSKCIRDEVAINSNEDDLEVLREHVIEVIWSMFRDLNHSRPSWPE